MRVGQTLRKQRRTPFLQVQLRQGSDVMTWSPWEYLMPWYEQPVGQEKAQKIRFFERETMMMGNISRNQSDSWRSQLQFTLLEKIHMKVKAKDSGS